jgi:hypothetical protein
LFTACKQKAEDAASSAEVTIDSVSASTDTSTSEIIPVAPAGKLAATATDEVEGKDGKIVSFTYDNNASTVSFELNGKQVVLTSKEKISDMPTANGRTYSNDELMYNNKDGIKITDKKGKLIFEEKQ